MGMSLEEALKCINDGSKVNELEIDTELRPDQLTKLLNCLKQKNNTTLFQIHYSLNLFMKENEKSKKAVSYLESFLLCNRLCSDDVNILNKYKDNQDTLNCPLTVDPFDFDNALHLYLYCLDSLLYEINRSRPATQDQYDVINYLLDKRVMLTPSTQEFLLGLVGKGVLSTYRLQLHENNYRKEGFHIAKYEQAKILGNSLGLAGQFKLSDMPAELQSDYQNHYRNEFEGVHVLFGAMHLLEALEQFVMNSVSIQFPQWTDHMEKVIATVKEGLDLHFLPVEEKINSVLDKLKQGEIVYLYYCGCITHNAPIILSPQSKSNLGMLIVCNKGDEMQEDKIATYYQLPGEEQLKHILKVAWIDQMKYSNMDAYLGSIEGLKEIDALEGKAQRVGSCVISNNRVAYHVIMGLCLGDKKVAEEIYKTFSNFQRTFELERFLASPIAQEDPDLIREILRSILAFHFDCTRSNGKDRRDWMRAKLKVLDRQEGAVLNPKEEIMSKSESTYSSRLFGRLNEGGDKLEESEQVEKSECLII